MLFFSPYMIGTGGYMLYRSFQADHGQELVQERGRFRLPTGNWVRLEATYSNQWISKYLSLKNATRLGGCVRILTGVGVGLYAAIAERTELDTLILESIRDPIGTLGNFTSKVSEGTSKVYQLYLKSISVNPDPKWLKNLIQSNLTEASL